MATDYELSGWLTAINRHCVPLYRPMRLEGSNEPLTLCGTGFFAKLPSTKRPFLLTASHCIQRDDDGALLPLYASVDQCLALASPLISLCVENPYDGVDFALFDASYTLNASKGEKEAMTISTWRVLDPVEDKEVVVLGYTKKRMQTNAEAMIANMILDAHPGIVSSLDKYSFFANAGETPPYAGALSIDNARGLSGSPCFRVVRLGELEYQLALCGLHRGATYGM